jgi:hypothetical protein
MLSPDAERGGMTPSERVLRARLAAYTMHARHDTRETTAAARAAFLDRFKREVDPDGTLSAAERQRRAAAARKAYFTRLALRSAQARRRRARRTDTGPEGDVGPRMD